MNDISATAPVDLASLESRANAGDVEALATLGWHLLTGREAMHNPELGVKAITRAADRGHSRREHEGFRAPRARGLIDDWDEE